jgi:hypothetical protein
MSPCRRPPHVRADTPGSPAGLLVTIDEDGPRGIAPHTFRQVCLCQKLNGSIGPSPQWVEREFPAYGQALAAAAAASSPEQEVGLLTSPP